MHDYCSHYEWEGANRCRHGTQQTRCWWVLKEWSGGEWTGRSFLITGYLYWLLLCLPGRLTKTKSNRLHLVERLTVCHWDCRVLPPVADSRQTNPVCGSHTYLDLQGKLANFSPPASCLWPVYLEAKLGRRYDSSTYNPLSSDIFSCLVSWPRCDCRGHASEDPPEKVTVICCHWRLLEGTCECDS